jgi:hypothetical protein
MKEEREEKKKRRRRRKKRHPHTSIYIYLFVIFYFRSDLIGCMSFNMKTLLKTTNCTKVRKSIKYKCEKTQGIGE